MFQGARIPPPRLVMSKEARIFVEKNGSPYHHLNIFVEKGVPGCSNNPWTITTAPFPSTGHPPRGAGGAPHLAPALGALRPRRRLDISAAPQRQGPGPRLRRVPRQAPGRGQIKIRGGGLLLLNWEVFAFDSFVQALQKKGRGCFQALPRRGASELRSVRMAFFWLGRAGGRSVQEPHGPKVPATPMPRGQVMESATCWFSVGNDPPPKKEEDKKRPSHRQALGVLPHHVPHGDAREGAGGEVPDPGRHQGGSAAFLFFFSFRFFPQGYPFECFFFF